MEANGKSKWAVSWNRLGSRECQTLVFFSREGADMLVAVCERHGRNVSLTEVPYGR